MAIKEKTNTSKDNRVQDEITRLTALFDGANPNQIDFISKHIQQLAWLGISILDLQKQVDKEGQVIPFQNGRNQSGYQANPACKLLIDYQKLYNTAFRALLPVLPDRPRTHGKLEELMNDYKREADELFPCGDLPLNLEDV